LPDAHIGVDEHFVGDVLGHERDWDLYVVLAVKLANVLLLDVLTVESTDESCDHS
jgi:hypothetical protein